MSNENFWVKVKKIAEIGNKYNLPPKALQLATKGDNWRWLSIPQVPPTVQEAPKKRSKQMSWL
jgi:hypothetical protein